jgi:hypothetical protein
MNLKNMSQEQLENVIAERVDSAKNSLEALGEELTKALRDGFQGVEALERQSVMDLFGAAKAFWTREFTTQWDFSLAGALMQIPDTRTSINFDPHCVDGNRRLPAGTYRAVALIIKIEPPEGYWECPNCHTHPDSDRCSKCGCYQPETD